MEASNEDYRQFSWGMGSLLESILGSDSSLIEKKKVDGGKTWEQGYFPAFFIKRPGYEAARLSAA